MVAESRRCPVDLNQGFVAVSPESVSADAWLPEGYQTVAIHEFVGVKGLLPDLVARFAKFAARPDWRRLRRAILRRGRPGHRFFCDVDRECAKEFVRLASGSGLLNPDAFRFSASGVYVGPNALVSKEAAHFLTGDWLELFAAIQVERVQADGPPPLGRVTICRPWSPGVHLCEFDVLVRSGRSVLAVVEAKSSRGGFNKEALKLAEEMGIPPERRILLRATSSGVCVRPDSTLVGISSFSDYLRRVVSNAGGCGSLMAH
ncbi:MAG: hypothetical protein D6725_14065 [Planctomycetota bacterium]|nr:MAG: hypothetical protein D6725_14065 [Planctomycetota bacterium]